MRLTTIGTILLLASPLTAPDASAQPGATENECQQATKLYAEADVLREFFEPYARGARFDGPALAADEGLTGKDSLQTKAKEHLDGCKSGGATATCNDYARIRTAAMGPGLGSGSAAGMVTHPQSCKIYDANGGEVTEAGAPSGGLARAEWMSMFRHEQFHQLNCRSENGSRTYPEDGTGANLSPYTLKMMDQAEHSREERTAYAITKDELEKYLEDNCFDPELDLDVPSMRGSCQDGASGKATLKSRPPKQADYAVRSGADWLSIPTTNVSTGADGKGETSANANCGCCNGSSKQTDVLAYGGPNQSILVKKSSARVSCETDENCASSSGDPHLCTYDGLAYDFHGVGEFVLSRTDTFEAQIRYQPVHGVGPASVGTAVAANLNGDRVSLYAADPPRLMINGVQVALDDEEEISLTHGGSITRNANRFRFASPGQHVVEARANATRVDLRVGMPEGTRGGGLFGDRNGDTADDLRPGAQPPLTGSVSFADLYGPFADAWRVTGETSLFDYAEDESAETFADRDLPKRQPGARDLDTAVRRQAEQTCREAGLTSGVNFENCIYDVGFTGDETYAQTAAEQRPPRTRLPVNEPGAPPAAPPAVSSSVEGVSINAPAEAFASHSVEVTITGPAQAGHMILFAPAGSDADGKPANPYSSRALKGGDQIIKLLAPYLPGGYELRYVPSRGEKSILLSRPFRSLPPQVSIDAPATGAAGGSLEVRCSGDLGPSNTTVVVPAGSPDKANGPGAVCRDGRPAQIRKLPAEPGQYEIRYVNGTAAGRQVYARKPLTIR